MARENVQTNRRRCLAKCTLARKREQTKSCNELCSHFLSEGYGIRFRILTEDSCRSLPVCPIWQCQCHPTTYTRWQELAGQSQRWRSGYLSPGKFEFSTGVDLLCWPDQGPAVQVLVEQARHKWCVLIYGGMHRRQCLGKDICKNSTSLHFASPKIRTFCHLF